MATDNSHRVIMGKMFVTTLPPLFLSDLVCSFFQVTWTIIKARMNSNFGQNGPRTGNWAALERLEMSNRLIIGELLWPLICLHF